MGGGSGRREGREWEQGGEGVGGGRGGSGRREGREWEEGGEGVKGEYDEEGEGESGNQRLVSYALEITEIQSLCSTLISLPLLCVYIRVFLLLCLPSVLGR